MAARKLLAALAVVAATAGTAASNGRPPLTNGVHFQPGDTHSIYVATTFGLLISHDDGCTFTWVCEQNMGYGGTFDPKYAIAADGTLFASTYNGLQVSRDGGCSWTTATAAGAGSGANLAGVWTDGIDIGPTGEVWLGTADSGHPNDVYRSVDDGMTFVGQGMLSPSIWWKSVKVAPSDAMRVYIGGYAVAGAAPDGGQLPPTAHLLHTENDGETWIESPLAGVAYGSTPMVHVMAVDPTNEDIIYVLSDVASPPNGDILYRSTDAGMTLTQVLATTDPIKDVVVRDAQTVEVATSTGASMSTDGGITFAPVSGAPQMQCLGQRGDGAMFACGANWDPDFDAVGRSSDGTAFSKVFRFVNLEGPLKCPVGTMQHDVCDVQMWPGLQVQFGTTGPTCGPDATDGGPPDAPKGNPASGSGGGCCDAGAAGGPVAILWTIAIVAYLARRRRA